MVLEVDDAASRQARDWGGRDDELPHPAVRPPGGHGPAARLDHRAGERVLATAIAGVTSRNLQKLQSCALKN